MYFGSVIVFDLLNGLILSSSTGNETGTWSVPSHLRKACKNLGSTPVRDSEI